MNALIERESACWVIRLGGSESQCAFCCLSCTPLPTMRMTTPVHDCQDNNLDPSMSRRGICWDNAVVESFFSSLKKERIKKRIYKTRDLAKSDVFDDIESFYNRTRRHSHLGGISPEAFERTSS